MLCNANYNSSYIQEEFFYEGEGSGIGRKRVGQWGEDEKWGSK